MMPNISQPQTTPWSQCWWLELESCHWKNSRAAKLHTRNWLVTGSSQWWWSKKHRLLTTVLVWSHLRHILTWNSYTYSFQSCFRPINEWQVQRKWLHWGQHSINGSWDQLHSMTGDRWLVEQTLLTGDLWNKLWGSSRAWVAKCKCEGEADPDITSGSTSACQAGVEPKRMSVSTAHLHTGKVSNQIAWQLAWGNWQLATQSESGPSTSTTCHSEANNWQVHSLRAAQY